MVTCRTCFLMSHCHIGIASGRLEDIGSLQQTVSELQDKVNALVARVAVLEARDRPIST
jgi:hypothetical protein